MQTPADVRTYQARTNLYRGTRGPWLEHMVEDCGCSVEEAAMLLEPFEIIPIIDEKKGHMASILKRNKEIHIAIFRRFRYRNQVTPKRIREHLQPLLDREHYLVTKVAKDEDSRFVEHLGFGLMGATMDGFKTYILTSINYPRPRHEHH